MKIFYLGRENFKCVVYADDKNEAFDKMKSECKIRIEKQNIKVPE